MTHKVSIKMGDFHDTIGTINVSLGDLSTASTNGVSTQTRNFDETLDPSVAPLLG